LSRIVFGTRISMLAGTISIALAVLLGTPLGMMAGLLGGWADRFATVLIDSMMSFPPLVLALGITAALGPSLRNVMIAIGFVYIPYFGRLARGQTLNVRERDYVTAVRAAGGSHLRIMLRHILPNIANSIIVQATINVAFAMLWEASLSFLGVGVQPPTPSWGSMLHEGYGYIHLAWWVAFPSGVAIVLVVLGFSFLGDGARDALDPSMIRAGKGGA
jgi:ABC-type dipeptide/oligopeptide/nickel transport system permease subunit